MSEQTIVPVEPIPFQPPTLEQRASEQDQKLLGDPTVAGWGAAQESQSALGSLQPKIGETADDQSVVGMIRDRVRNLHDVYKAAPESAKDRWQLKAMVGAAAVLSVVTIRGFLSNKLGAPELADKATLVAGLYGMGGMAAYKTRKYGFPGSRPNARQRQTIASERRQRFQERNEWDHNLARIRSGRQKPTSGLFK